MKRNKENQESGNAFFMIMIGVVLFAALMFTFARGARQGGGTLSKKQAEISASDIISYTQKVERAVARVYSKEFSENDISFENNFVSSYTNVNCGAGQDRCKIFKESGGSISYKPLEANWSLTQTNWFFTAANEVTGIESTCGGTACTELLMVLKDVPLSLCTALNEQLDITSGGSAPPANAAINTSVFTGAFTYAVTLSGARTGCYINGGNYYFYYTVLER